MELDNKLNEKEIKLKNSIGIHVRYSKEHEAAILFLHFSGGTSHIWDGVIPLFMEQYSIIAPDMRGHGKSDKPICGYHIDDLANDMYLLLQELDITHVHIIGSSMGAEVGLSLAASHPELVDSFICEGALYNEFGEYGLLQGNNKEINTEKAKLRIELEERKETVYNTKLEFIEAEKKSFLEYDLWNDFVLTFVESNMQETKDGYFTSCYTNQVRKEYIEKYWEVKFEDYYKKVNCPILFLPSEEEWENDKIRNILKVFTSNLNNYEIEVIKGSIHAYLWMQLPQVAGETVKNFLCKNEVHNGRELKI